MGSRERRRAERRKRKERSAENRAERETKLAEMSSRSEAKNEAVREDLEPLAEGERPTVVTVGAVVSALIALSAIVGYAAGVEVTKVGSDGIEQGSEQAPVLSVAAVVGLMGVMAWGMWRVRYWAVLGFQALLVILIVAGSLGLIQATEWPQAVGTTVLVAGGGTLFYFMVRAMARIQMPERPSRE